MSGATTDQPDDPYAEAKRRVYAGEFPGFPAPTSNWHRVPNVLTDIKYRIITDAGDPERDIPPGSASACVILDYILRHTWGFREYGEPKRITTDEFINGRKLRDGTRMDRGSGISYATVIKCLKHLERRGYLTVERDDHDRGRSAKLYAVRFAPGVHSEDW